MHPDESISGIFFKFSKFDFIHNYRMYVMYKSSVVCVKWFGTYTPCKYVYIYIILRGPIKNKNKNIYLYLYNFTWVC